MPDDSTERKLAAIVFTDIVGSTRLKNELGDHGAVALIKRHHGLVRETLAGFKQGEEIETAGDSFFVVFSKPSDAVKFALRLQSKLRAFSQKGHPISVRIGIHVGEVLIEGVNSEKTKAPSGIHVDTCARLMSLGQGDQILMTRFVFDNARQVLRGQDVEGVGPLSWLNHGPYLLKGVEEPLEVCEVGEAGKGALTPPTSSEKARRHVSDESEPVLGWRPALELRVPGTEWILEKKLGEGGFGEVWLGRHEKLKDRRVFKFCFRADRVRSLKREVTLFRVLKERVGHHPNIVGVQEVYFNEPPFYIVMDYAQAADLGAWCEKEGFENISVARRLEIVAQVADGLQAAHEAGVIHRDVKPSNILVGGQGSVVSDQQVEDPTIRFGNSSSSASTNPKSEIRDPKLEVKLTDFGIGQVVSQEALAGMTRMGFTQTMLSPGSSSQTGTHLYMAPELLAGKPASTRSDTYSLGVVLYQLLVGDFTRPLTMDWIKRIGDPLLCEDLEKCFAGNPEERFTSAGELARALRSLPQRQAKREACERSAQRRKVARAAAIVGIILTALFALGVFVVKRGALGNAEESVGTKNPQAIDFYNRGKSYVFSNSSMDELRKAVDWFEQAIALDTNFARAYVSLAHACRQLDTVWEPGRGWGAKALAAADKALSLDPGLADAWVTRGALFFTPAGGWDVGSGVKYQRKAIALNPKVKNAHVNLAFVYGHIGFLKEAIEELDQEHNSYPLDPTPQWIRGWILLSQGDYLQALKTFEPLPEAAFFHPRLKAFYLGTCLFYLKRTDEASKVLEDKLKKLPEPDDPLLLSILAIIDAKRGQPEKAKERIKGAEAWENRFIHFHHVSYNIGSAYALLDEKKLALEWLKKSAEDGNPCYPCFKGDPILQNLRGDQEFETFLRKLQGEYEHNRASHKP